MHKTKYAYPWLATLAVAIATLAHPLTAGAAETGPDKNPAPATTKATGSRTPANSTSKRDTYPFRGKIASFDAKTQALTLEGRTTRRVIHLNAQTRLVRQGQPARAEDLKAGEPVGGTLRKSPEGREEALLIRIGPKDNPAAPSTPASPANPGQPATDPSEPIGSTDTPAAP